MIDRDDSYLALCDQEGRDPACGSLLDECRCDEDHERDDQAYTQVVARVQKGAALLDAYDSAWWKEIEEARLDMTNCLDCILGQKFGTYAAGVTAFGISADQIAYFYVEQQACGFDLDCEASLSEWSMLRDAWLAEIRARAERAQ